MRGYNRKHVSIDLGDELKSLNEKQQDRLMMMYGSDDVVVQEVVNRFYSCGSRDPKLLSNAIYSDVMNDMAGVIDEMNLDDLRELGDIEDVVATSITYLSLMFGNKYGGVIDEMFVDEIDDVFVDDISHITGGIYLLDMKIYKP